MSPEADRRLHPLSLLFHLGERLRELIIPLLVAVFATRSDTFRLVVPAVIAVFASVAAIAKYLSQTYRYDEDDLVVRTGILFRNERHIPYDRIQNIDAVQNVAHRFLKVAVVQVQTGSSSEPEATLSVLPLGDLAEMRRRVLGGRKEPATVDPADPAAVIDPPAPLRLLHIEPRELMLAGFIENRGMALVAAALGALLQFDLEERLPEVAPGWAQRVATITADGAPVALGVTVLFLLAVLGIRVLSTVWAVVRLYDFTLVRDGADLRAEYGLFTRVTATIPLRRVQTISVHQRWLHRRLGRAAVRVTTAGASGIPGGGKDLADREWLAPIIRVEDVRALVHHIDPSLELEGIDWTPVHPRAARRMMRVSLVWGAAIAGLSALFVGWWSLVVAGMLGLRAVAQARGLQRNLGCALVGDRVVFRSGWLHRVVSIARFERIQAALCLQTPFDRRSGMASVAVDTAGLAHTGLAMPYLPEPVARRLHARLTEAAVQTPFTW